jgi:hypothetical protein
MIGLILLAHCNLNVLQLLRIPVCFLRVLLVLHGLRGLLLFIFHVSTFGLVIPTAQLIH